MASLCLWLFINDRVNSVFCQVSVTESLTLFNSLASIAAPILSAVESPAGDSSNTLDVNLRSGLLSMASSTLGEVCSVVASSSSWLASVWPSEAVKCYANCLSMSSFMTDIISDIILDINFFKSRFYSLLL